jgi:trigger factor
LKVEYAEETPVRKSLSFEIDASVVDQEIADRAKDYAKKLKLPGFRAGKVPTHVVKQRFKANLLEDVAEKLVNKVVFEEIEGRGLKPLASPKVVDLKIDENQPLTFRAVFETLPIVELPDWRGLRAKARQANVQDADVERELEGLRENAAQYEPVEGRAIETGDFVVGDLSWRSASGGKPRRNENALFEVGSAEMNKDLSAALLGASPGETKQVRVKYEPKAGEETAPAEEIDYTIAIKAIKKKVLPALDDDFAKDLGEFGSLQELREDVRKKLVAAEQRKIDRELKGALVDALVEKSELEVPEALVERHMTARAENAVRGLAMQGIDPRTIGVDWRQYRDGQREESVKAAKADILLDEIARREAVDATDLEMDAEISRLAERLKKSKEATRAQMEKEGELAGLRARIREEKVLDLLKSNARVELEG